MALDPRIQLLMWVIEKSGNGFRPDVTVDSFRKSYSTGMRNLGLKASEGVAVRELSIPMDDGTSIGARLYRPEPSAGEAPLPVLLYFHGGGWVVGDVDSYDGLTRFLAREGRIAVLSVDYRLGPEHPFPRGHEDAFGALKWLQENAGALGLAPDRIAVGGDSAGGGLAATLASYAESRGLRRPDFAFLIYPSVDGTARFPSRKHFTGNYPLTPEVIKWFAKNSTSGSGDKSMPLFVPLDAPNPERHPPTHILAAAYDPLVDEGHAYYKRLHAAGVPATYDLRETLPHAFVGLAGIVPEARRALVDGIQVTAAALGIRRVAALTGAGSGIGRALAHDLARLGYALALADSHEGALAETVREVEGGTKVTSHLVDVANKAQVDDFAERVLAEHGRVDLLINNAGVGLAGDVEELAVEEIEWLMNVNFWGTVYGVKAFLPALKRAGDATIVNISSAYGLFGPPGQAAYAASKFAVRGFSESLRAELRAAGVHVLTVHPGGIKTNIVRNSRIAAGTDHAKALARGRKFEDVALKLHPRTAAHAIVRGIRRHADRVLIGEDAVRIDLITRALGPAGSKLLGEMFLRGAAKFDARWSGVDEKPVTREKTVDVRTS
jgi:acetyl esterase/lipase/NAD(P)-dependent dehydrogenase (short-subunit alcohol dehydrogenase family)